MDDPWIGRADALIVNARNRRVPQRCCVEEKVIFSDPAETGDVPFAGWARESLNDGLRASLTPFLPIPLPLPSPLEL